MSTVTSHELEQQADLEGDGNLQLFASQLKPHLRVAEERLLNDPRWLEFGERNTDSHELLAFLRRLTMGVFGGLALLVPMIIMVLSPTKLTALLTTIICVLFVAVALSIAMRETEPKDIFAAIAAYTAVLVVFVGTNTTLEGGNNRVVGAITGGVMGGILLFLCLWFGFFYSLFNKREGEKEKKLSDGFLEDLLGVPPPMEALKYG